MKTVCTKTYIGLLAVAAAMLLTITFDPDLSNIGWPAIAGTAALFLLNVMAIRFPVNFSKGSVEIIDVAVILALILFGPFYALIVAIPSLLYRDKLRVIFVSSSEVLLIFSASAAFGIFSQPLLEGGSFNADFVYAVFLGSTVYYTLDMMTNTLLMRIKHGESTLINIRELFLPKIPSDILAILAALGTAYVLVVFGPAAALVLFLGGAGALISLNLIHTRQRENEALKRENADLLAQNVRFVAAMVGAIGTKEPSLVRLANASSVYAGDVGAEFGFYREHLDRLRIAALLQDIGFAGIPDAVMKAAPKCLNAAGRIEFERHPVIGEEILARIPGFEEPAKWVRWHHERMDGSGFPDGLKSQWIPLEARILAATSAYASLVCDTREAAAITPKEARLALTSEVNGDTSRLDAEVVKALLRVLDREGASYAAAIGEQFSRTAEVEVSRGVPRLRVVGSGR